VKIKKQIRGFITQSVFYFVLLTSCNPIYWTGITLPTPEVTHIDNTTFRLRKIWSKTNIYAVENEFNAAITAGSGKVCFLADIKNIKFERKLFCLNGLNGDILWERQMQSTATAISFFDNGIYVAYSGGSAGVRKYDIETGKIDWSQYLHGTGIVYLYTFRDQVQLLTAPEIFYILNAVNGDIIRKKSKDLINWTLIETTEITVIKTGYELHAIDTQTGTSKWSVELNDVLNKQPLFSNDKVILRTGRTYGNASAIDLETGKEVWKTEDNIIGNPAYSPKTNRIYVLSRDGELIGIDKDNGRQISMTIFTPNPFALFGEKEVGGYELAFDETSGTLFVLLGDSRQLFAFQEQ
jgi:outer membrane protein assembly factor BamB